MSTRSVSPHHTDSYTANRWPDAFYSIVLVAVGVFPPFVRSIANAAAAVVC